MPVTILKWLQLKKCMVLMIDIIAGIITGSNSCDGDCSLDDMSSSLCSGNFLLAFKIESMIDYDAGENEYLNEETSRREGVKVSRGTWDNVKSIIG